MACAIPPNVTSHDARATYVKYLGIQKRNFICLNSANRYVATVPDTYCNDYGYTRGQKYTKTTGSP